MSDLNLNVHEARMLGVLIEKSFTTPDSYPLTLNAATSGCNQKSNRDPVVDWLEDEVYVALTGLCHKLLAGKVSPAGSRVEKFKHNANQSLGLSEGALAVLAELLMRGPQTPGELRARAHRMVAMPQQADLGRHVEELVGKRYAAHVAPKPGSRAARVAQTLVPGLHPVGTLDAQPERAATAGAPAERASTAGRESAPPPQHGGGGSWTARVAALEDEVRWLRRELLVLASKLGESIDAAAADEDADPSGALTPRRAHGATLGSAEEPSDDPVTEIGTRYPRGGAGTVRG